MTDQFTHNFNFEVDDAGGQFIKGDVEFNTDGKVSFKIQNSATPLKRETLALFVEFLDYIYKIFEKTGGISSIKVVKKAV